MQSPSTMMIFPPKSNYEQDLRASKWNQFVSKKNQCTPLMQDKKPKKLDLNHKRNIMKYKTPHGNHNDPERWRMNSLSWNWFGREKWSLLTKTPSPRFYLQIPHGPCKNGMEKNRSTHNVQEKRLSNQVQKHSSKIHKISSQSFLYCRISKSQKSFYNEWVHEYIESLIQNPYLQNDGGLGSNHNPTKSRGRKSQLIRWAIIKEGVNFPLRCP